jgi:hypothetical protein
VQVAGNTHRELRTDNERVDRKLTLDVKIVWIRARNYLIRGYS